jgi:hypothetical protein
MTLRRRQVETPTSSWLEHWLTSGCILGDGAVSSELYALAGALMRPWARDAAEEKLRQLWRAHGPAIKAKSSGLTFAERFLNGASYEEACHDCRDTQSH